MPHKRRKHDTALNFVAFLRHPNLRRFCGTVCRKQKVTLNAKICAAAKTLQTRHFDKFYGVFTAAQIFAFCVAYKSRKALKTQKIRFLRLPFVGNQTVFDWRGRRNDRLSWQNSQTRGIRHGADCARVSFARNPPRSLYPSPCSMIKHHIPLLLIIASVDCVRQKVTTNPSTDQFRQVFPSAVMWQRDIIKYTFKGQKIKVVTFCSNCCTCFGAQVGPWENNPP